MSSCNFPFIILTKKNISLTVQTNNCEKAGNDIINILTIEDMENMLLRSTRLLSKKIFKEPTRPEDKKLGGQHVKC